MVLKLNCYRIKLAVGSLGLDVNLAIIPVWFQIRLELIGLVFLSESLPRLNLRN